MINPSSRGISERRRQNINRVDDMTTKDTTVSGRYLISGIGEVAVDILFPVAFGQRPIFTFGGELERTDPPQPVIHGSYPKVHAVVASWTVVREVKGAFDGYYTGCTVAVTIEGFATQTTWFDYNFHAPAIRNPVTYEDNTDEAL